MAITERIRLDDSQYRATWSKVNRTAERGAKQHKKAYRKIRNETTKTGERMNWLQRQSQKMGKKIKFFLGTIAVSGILALTMAFRDMSREQVRFDQAMNESLAIMGDVTLSQRKRMEETARAVSNELNMASDKVAESFYFLASAGLDVEQQIEALPAVAEFAKAGMFDMATATDLATDAQSALGLTVEDSVQNQKNLIRVTDVLVNANQDANASVEQFSEALTNRGAAALKSVNKEIEEGVGLLAAYADQGIKGRRAGMFLSRTLRILSQSAADNTEEFTELGLIDAEGNLASLSEIVRILSEELDGMSDTAKSARLEQLGFTARVQDAIKPVLGLSDEIKEYTESAKEAGGATKEVADNQMKSLQERAGKLWTQFKNTFGDDFIELMENALSRVEDLSDEIGTIFERMSGTGTEKLLRTLRDIDASPELIARLEKQQAIEEAQSLRDEIQSELDEMEVPLSIDDKGFMSKLTGMVTSFFDPRDSMIGTLFKGEGFFAGDTVFSSFAKSMDELQNFEFSGEGFDPDRMDRYREAVGEAQANLLMLSNRVTQAKEAGEDVPDVVIEQIQKYREQINTIQDIIQKYEALQNAEDAVEEAKNKTIETTKDQNETFEDSGDLLAQNLADTAQWASRLLSVTEDISKIKLEDTPLAGNLTGDDVESQMQGLNSSLDDYNRKLTELRNKFSAGVIGEEEFEQASRELREGLLSQLRKVYGILDSLGLLTPQLQKDFRKLFKAVEKDAKDAGKESDKIGNSFADIANALDAIGSSASQIGLISDEFADAIDHSADLLRNFDKMKDLIDEGDLSFGSMAMPTIGAVSGAVGLISQIRQINNRSEEERKKLINNMQELSREIARNTEALMKQSIVGGNISTGQIEEAQGLLSDIDLGWVEGEIDDIPNAFIRMLGNIDKDKEIDAIIREWIDEDLSEILNRLSETGIDALSDIDAEFFKGLMSDIGGEEWSQEELEKAINILIEGGDDFEGISNILDELEENLGAFGDSLEGAIERFNMATKLGMDRDEAFATFIDDVQGLIGEDNEITSLLEDLVGAEGEKERKDLAQQIWEEFQANPELLGDDLTGSDLQEIIDLVLRQGDGGSSSEQEFSRSVQVSRAITEMQANEVVALLHAQLLEQKGIHSLLRGEAGFNMPAFDTDLQSWNGIENNYDIDISIGDVRGEIDDVDIDNIMENIRIEMKDEVRNQGFYRQ